MCVVMSEAVRVAVIHTLFHHSVLSVVASHAQLETKTLSLFIGIDTKKKNNQTVLQHSVTAGNCSNCSMNPSTLNDVRYK